MVRDLIRLEQERVLEIESIRQALIEGVRKAVSRNRSTSPRSRNAKSRSVAEYRLSPRAQRDLDAIFDDTMTHWDLPHAMRYADHIEATCADLAEAPQRAQGCAHIRPGHRRRGGEQYVIYFRPARYGIAVMRILHQRMDAAHHL